MHINLDSKYRLDVDPRPDCATDPRGSQADVLEDAVVFAPLSGE
jgi:hypothetical protein